MQQHGKYRFASRSYTLTPKRHVRYERRIMALATMVALWDVLEKPILVLTLLLWLLVLLITKNGLVALYYNWSALRVPS